jgi:hypothetical protein
MMMPHSEESLVLAAKADGIDQLVVGAIVPRLNKSCVEILVLDRVCDDYMGGIEEFPSGKVESGESLTDALKRDSWRKLRFCFIRCSATCFRSIISPVVGPALGSLISWLT